MNILNVYGVKRKKILSLDNNKFSELEIHFPFQENIHFNVCNVNYCKIEKKIQLFGKGRHKPVLELTELLKEWWTSRKKITSTPALIKGTNMPSLFYYQEKLLVEEIFKDLHGQEKNKIFRKDKPSLLPREFGQWILKLFMKCFMYSIVCKKKSRTFNFLLWRKTIQRSCCLLAGR